ncbi:metallophosphoesterase family protein [Luteimonas viscosa]|uniref:Metallophosphoesterase family protein n=1 Tax=Luteimonas viscosa TaxID=1132694 RepID=A0A5D4XWK6_9GAMM|nr:FN3 domain-containing metallophosphoesterase family protein [Luteimonas viscosa]TYT27280.1 metallophosphoesterase family protein [Luteimonas viscosa]
MSHRVRFATALLLVLPALAALAEAPPAARHVEPNTLVPKGVVHYAPTGFPDRIVAVPMQDASTGFSVSWRTDAAVDAPALEIVVAKDSPDQWDGDTPPRQVKAATRRLATANGVAHHHQASIDGLRPGTLYAWRVQGDRTWSPWRHLRTAAPVGTPLEFLYVGDTQNKNASLTTRVMFEAVRRAPNANLVLFAGDLVSEAVDDDEWGEWFDATAPLATMAFAPAPGNHEFFEEHEDTPQERRVLGEQWKAHFALPANGAEGVEPTTYWFDYQGIRFAVIDGTSALDLDAASTQAAWLDGVLADNPNRWSMVLIHQPFHSPRGEERNKRHQVLRDELMPVMERHGVDLVLQGHDHLYGRRGSEGGVPPVYVVSVAGPKQYLVSDDARATMSPVGEDTQLFQVLRLEGNRLSYEARTATGRLYDAFALIDEGDAGKRIEERTEGRIGERECGRSQTLGGRTDRCWE